LNRAQRQPEWPPVGFGLNRAQRRPEWPPVGFGLNRAQRRPEWPPLGFGLNRAQRQPEWPPVGFGLNRAQRRPEWPPVRSVRHSGSVGARSTFPTRVAPDPPAPELMASSCLVQRRNGWESGPFSRPPVESWKN